MKRIASILIVSLFLSYPVSSVIGLSEEPDAVALQDKARKETIRFGTDAEILQLLKTIEEEKLDSYDGDLLALLDSSKNAKIKEALLRYFESGNKEGAEKIALRMVVERDLEPNTVVDAAIAYLSKKKSSAAASGLRDILDAEESRFVVAAARALGSCGSESDVDFIVDYFDTRNPTDATKQELIYSLGELKSKKAAGFLESIVANQDERPGRRMIAVEALGKISDPRSVPIIAAAFNEPDANLRVFVITALGKFPASAEVKQTIIEGFRDSFYKVRSAAAAAAASLKLGEAVPFLQYRANRDEVPTVREEAVRALGAIADSEAVDALEKLFMDTAASDRVRQESAGALLAIDADRQAEKIIAALDKAKEEKKMPLYHGLAKKLTEAKSKSLEDLARRLIASSDSIDKHYALDIVIMNGIRSLDEKIQPLAEDKNVALARKARKALGNQ